MTYPIRRPKPNHLKLVTDSDPASELKLEKIASNEINAVALPEGIRPANDPCTDVANAQRLYAAYAKSVMFVDGIDWFHWTGVHWKKDKHRIVRLAQNLGLMIAGEVTSNQQNFHSLIKWAKESESRSRIDAAIKLLKSYVNTDVDKLDSDPFLLNVSNGTVDLRSQLLLEHNREDLITRKVDVPYDPLAECPLFLKTISRVLNYDPELISYFQRICGYFLTGNVREQVLFILYGVGANGKSTIVGILLNILGAFAKLAAPNLLLSSIQARHPTELADLMGARLVVASETPEKGRFNENLVKQLTGGDPIKARFMRQDFFEFLPTHKFAILTNHKPTIEGSDVGIWRRIHLIPFQVVIPKDEQDQELPEKLKLEQPGILKWCVDGCAEWLKQGLNPPESVTAATAEYRSDQDVFSQFLSDCCSIRREKQVMASVLYKRYQTWCLECGETPLSQVVFWQRLSEKGITKTRTSRGFLYHGIEVNQQY